MKFLDNLSQIRNGDNIFIYGAGSFGITFKSQLKRKRPDINVINFIDKNKQGFIDQTEIKKINGINNNILDKKIIICTSADYWDEIEDELNNFEILFNRYHDFNIYFRESNYSYDDNDLLNLFSEDRKKLLFYLSCMNNENIKELLDSEDMVDEHDKFIERINLKYGDTIINGGSEFGNENTLFSKYVGKKGNIISFDGNISGEKVEGNKSYYPYLLGEKSGKIGFIFDGSRSRISKTSDTLLDSISIDDFMIKNHKNKIDLITLDVEGSELNVLKGAEKTIKQFNPNLAISVYHSKADFFEIPFYLKNINNRYSFNLGIYNNQACDTFLHATLEEH